MKGKVRMCRIAVLAILMTGCSCQHGIGITGESDTDTEADTISDPGLDMPYDPDGMDVEVLDTPVDIPVDTASTDCWVEPEVLSNWMIRIAGDDNVVPNHVAIGHDGRIIVSGSSGPPGDLLRSDESFWLLELDGDGSILDQIIVDGAFGISPRFWSSRTSAIPLSDCGLLLAGASDGGDVGGVNIWLARLDASGSVQWQKQAGGPGTESDPAVVETHDGGLLLAATTDSATVSGDTDIWLAKLDADASIVWQKRIGGAEDDEMLMPGGLFQSDDGTVYLSFLTWNLFPTSTSVLMSFSADGDLLWQRAAIIEGSTERSVHVKSVISDDDSIVIGGNIKTTALQTAAWLAKLDRIGGLIWQKAIHSGEGADIWALSAGDDSDFLASGSMVIEASEERQSKLWIASITADGEISWQYIIGDWERDSGRDIDDWHGQAIHHFDGIVAIGEDESHSDPDIHSTAVARLKLDGTFPGTCSFIRNAEAITVEATAVLVDSDILVQDAAGVFIDADAVIRDADLPIISLCPE